MIATTKLEMDLVTGGRLPLVKVVCDDQYSRALQITLLAQGEAISLPSDCTALVRYCKEDGVGGSYDTLPDGTKAWSIAENVVTVMLAPQVCNVEGRVKLTVTLISGKKELNCFTVYLDVRGHVGDPAQSESYVHLTGYLPQPQEAQTGMYLRVAAVENGKVTAVETVSGVSQGGTAPDYVRQEALRLAEVVQAHQSADTLSILACSDAHYSAVHNYAAQMGESVCHCGQAMAVLRRQLHLDGAAMLGDMVWDGGETGAEALEAMRYVNEQLADGFMGLPNFHTRGNHECVYHSEGGLTDQQIFANVGAHNADVVCAEENRLGGWCYRDYDAQKLRLVCINTSESADGAMAVSTAQNTWLASALVVPEGWSTVLLSHHPLDWNGSGSNVMRTVQAATNVLCNIHGHTHCYATGLLGGTEIPRIAIPNVSFYRNNEYGENGGAENAEGTEFGETTTYSKTAGTAQDTAFCVITIDHGAGKIYADHYGAGYDRVITIGGEQQAVYQVTKQLTNVTLTGADTVVEGASYSATLTALAGYSISQVSVSMGGADVTATAYSNGNISIAAVSGAIVITAVAESTQAGYTNLVPNALDYDLEGVFNEVGYQNGYYVSTTAPYISVTTDGSVATGLIPYDIYGGVNGYDYQPPTIYIKGITFDTSNSHNRMGFFITEGEHGNKVVYSTQKVAQLSTYFNIETLGNQYYKLTPIMVEETGRNMLATTWIATVKISHICISGNGDGANLIVTLDEPIE